MKITTWDELQAMTPDERREHFARSIVRDPANHPDPVIRGLWDDAVTWSQQQATPTSDGA